MADQGIDFVRIPDAIVLYFLRARLHAPVSGGHHIVINFQPLSLPGALACGHKRDNQVGAFKTRLRDTYHDRVAAGSLGDIVQNGFFLIPDIVFTGLQ